MAISMQVLDRLHREVQKFAESRHPGCRMRSVQDTSSTLWMYSKRGVTLLQQFGFEATVSKRLNDTDEQYWHMRLTVLENGVLALVEQHSEVLARLSIPAEGA